MYGRVALFDYSEKRSSTLELKLQLIIITRDVNVATMSTLSIFVIITHVKFGELLCSIAVGVAMS